MNMRRGSDLLPDTWDPQLRGNTYFGVFGSAGHDKVKKWAQGSGLGTYTTI